MAPKAVASLLLLLAAALAGCTSGSDQRSGDGAGYTNGTAYNHNSYGYPTTNGTPNQNATVTGTGTPGPGPQHRPA